MAKKKATSKRTARSDSKVRLIVSDESNPAIPLMPGHRFEVATVDVFDAESQKPSTGAARLCGGTSTCLALIDISE